MWTKPTVYNLLKNSMKIPEFKNQTDEITELVNPLVHKFINAIVVCHNTQCVLILQITKYT